jgi:cytochrome c oxidase subunit 1/cytochrome c oxidase subunit I+III
LLLDHGRETVGTAPLDGEPELILEMPGDTIAPFCLALSMGLLFAAGLGHIWWLAALAAAFCVVALMVWFWPHRADPATAEPADG